MKFLLRYSDIINNIHNENFVAFFKSIISQVNKIYVLLDIDTFTEITNIKEQAKIANAYEKKLRSLGFPFHRIILNKGENIRSLMNRNHLDMLLSTNQDDATELKDDEFVDWFSIAPQDFVATKASVKKKIEESLEPILSRDTKRTTQPSVDRIWLQYYNKKALKDLKRYSLEKKPLWKHIVDRNSDFLYDIAIEYYGKQFTYHDLIENVKKFQKAFLHMGVKPGDSVSLCVPNVPDGVFAYYALTDIGAIPSPLHVYSKADEMKHYFQKEKTKFVVMIGMNSTCENIKTAIEDTEVEKVVVVPLSNHLDQRNFESIKMKLGVLLLSSKFGSFLAKASDLVKKYKLEKREKQFQGTLFSYLKEDYLQTPSAFKMPKDDRFVSVKDFLEKGKEAEITCGYNKISTIIHTGGTTGPGKSTLLSHDNINSNDDAFEATIPDFEKGDTIIAIPPMFHILGLNNCINLILRNGGKIVLISKYRKGDLPKLFKKHHPELLFGVPKIGRDIIKSKGFQENSFNHLKYYVLGGEEMTKQFIDESYSFIQNHGASIDVSQSLGGTEGSCSYTNTFNNCNIHGSIGIPLINVTAKIVTEDCNGDYKEVGYNEYGEICFQGDSIMVGYLDDEEATNKALKREDGKVWLHTGDCGYIDENGILFFVDRIKYMFKINGEQVYPSEIKKVIQTHPNVQDCVVYCVENETGQKRIATSLTLKNPSVDYQKVQEEISMLCARTLRRESIPSVIDIRDTLPETNLFKVDTNALKTEQAKKIKIYS